MITVRDLVKYFGEKRAIGPLSFAIETGSVVGMLGLNGAGKTTTLRILACDLLPSSGTVLVDGLDVVENPHEVRAKIGYLPDTPPLYGEMTVADYLTFAASLRGVPKSKQARALDRALEVTQLQSVAYAPIATLSHGFRQRVGIAQAVVHEPELVILDEPISGLDPAQIVEMRELLAQLKGQHTILISSHILSEVHQTCDRLLVIRDGAIVASGNQSDLLKGSAAQVAIQVEVRPGRDGIEETLRSVPGVLTVSAAGRTEDASQLLRVMSEHDNRPAIAAAVVGAGFDLVGLSAGATGLEALFLDLTRAAEPKRRRSGRKKRATKASARTDASGASEAS